MFTIPMSHRPQPFWLQGNPPPDDESDERPADEDESFDNLDKLPPPPDPLPDPGPL